MGGSFDTLPEAMRRLVPELDPSFEPTERKADCLNCPLEARPGEPLTPERPFRRDMRCCTYHPSVANFFVGRILNRGGPGAKAMRLRIQLGESIHPLGVLQPDPYHIKYLERRTTGFGNDVSLLCPYWLRQRESCGIWADRSSICRSWHCRHETGTRGKHYWLSVQTVLLHLETVLTGCCVEDGDPPDPFEGVKEIEAWYRWTASHVDDLSADRLATLRSETLDHKVATLVAARQALQSPPPEVLGPVISNVERMTNHVRLTGYSFFDPLEVPLDIFQLIGQLDGHRSIDQALARANQDAEPGATVWTQAHIEQLWKAGLLEARDSEEASTTRPSGRVDAMRMSGDDLAMEVPESGWQLVYEPEEDKDPE